MFIGNVGHGNWAGIAHEDRANSNDYCLMQNTDGTVILNSKSNKLLYFRQGNSDRAYFRSDGEFYIAKNVGIGTTNPVTKLHVNGGVLIGNVYTAVSGPWTTSNAQLVLGGSHNAGFNTGTKAKLVITGYDNDGATIYPIYCEDENGKVDFYIKGAPSDGGIVKAHLRGDLTWGVSSKLTLDQSGWQSCGNIELTSGSGTFGFHATGSNTLSVYVDGNIRTDGIYYLPGGVRGLRSVTGGYGTVQTTGSGQGNWEGYSIDARYVFMSYNNDEVGIYNDLDNKWLWLYNRPSTYHRWWCGSTEMMRLYNGELRLYNTGNNNSNALRIYTSDGGGMWGIKWNGSGTNYNAYLMMKNDGNGTEQAVGRWENDTGHTNHINFTGQHKCMSVNNLDATNMCGLIAYSTGKYMNINNTISPQINESLPICNICATDNDVRVFGIISDEKDDNEDNFYGYGAFKTAWIKTNKNETRLFMNSVGEGAVWVCNKNGNMLNGDYITSCTIPGYGAKQDDDVLHNYTAAKITCDCDFSLTKIVKQKIKVNIITTTSEVQDFRLIDKEIEEEKVVYDATIQGYIEKVVTRTEKSREEIFETVPIYDAQGIQKVDEKGNLRTYERPVMKTFTETKQELIYDSNGNIQYEDDLDENGNQQIVYEYDTRFLNADGTLITTETEYLTKKNAGENVNIACFVGCTYHCG